MDAPHASPQTFPQSHQKSAAASAQYSAKSRPNTSPAQNGNFHFATQRHGVDPRWNQFPQTRIHESRKVKQSFLAQTHRESPNQKAVTLSSYSISLRPIAVTPSPKFLLHYTPFPPQKLKKTYHPRDKPPAPSLTQQIIQRLTHRRMRINLAPHKRRR